MDVHSRAPVKLDLGAGDKRHEGFLRVGLQPDHDIRCDLREIALPDDYADEAQAIHVIEHFFRWDALDVLREWRRVLKPGGLLVLELPDLAKCCRNFLKDGGEKPRRSLWGLYGDPNYRNELMTHRFGYTPASLAALLREAGFVKIKHRPPAYHMADRDMRLEAKKPA